LLARSEYDWAETAPSTAVVETVAEATGEPITEIGPLYDSIDPDALDTLFQPHGTSPQCNDGYVSFEFADHTVAVHANGSVTLRESLGDI
jgi:hypothetical protein